MGKSFEFDGLKRYEVYANGISVFLDKYEKAADRAYEIGGIISDRWGIREDISSL